MANLVTSTMEKDDLQEDELEQQNVEESEESNEEESEVEETDDVSDDDSNESDDDTEEELKKQRYIKRRLKKKLQTKPKGDVALEKRLERLELRQEGYSDSVIDEIQSLGGMDFVKKNKIAQRVIQEMQEDANVKRAASATSKGGSSTRTNVSLADLQNMSAEEMEKHLPKA